MYGTVSQLRIKPGLNDRLGEFARDVESESIPGHVFTYVYQTDADASTHIMVVGFTSREAYRANATSPRQNAQYLKLRELLSADPEWHDGEIIFSHVPA